MEEYRRQLDLGDATFHRIDHGDGIIAHVYKVVDSSDIPKILKLSPQREHYFRELFFLDRLKGSLPVPKVLGTVAPTASLDGAILMECFQGTLIPPEKWTDTLAYEVGATLARLHLHSAPGYGDPTCPEQLIESPQLYLGQKFEEELHECQNHLPAHLVAQCHQYYQSRHDSLASVDGPCMVHRDFRPGNIIVASGHLQGVIDWASGRFGFAEQDVFDWDHRPYRDAFLAGYSKIRPMPAYQVVMPLLQLARALAVIGYTAKTNTWQTCNAQLYSHYRQVLDRFDF